METFIGSHRPTCQEELIKYSGHSITVNPWMREKYEILSFSQSYPSFCLKINLSREKLPTLSLDTPLTLFPEPDFCVTINPLIKNYVFQRNSYFVSHIILYFFE